MSARRGWAWPLVPLYAAGLALKDGLRAAGVLRTRRLEWPVVSVGSLSAGGAGKTPVVIALAELLHARGWTVDVLSRGYGREGTGVERVDPEAERAAARFGDEPVMMARRLGVPVWVAAERYEAGVAGEKQNTGVLRSAQNDKQKSVHLLDDGFQHRRLARAVDVVVVTVADLDDALLPAGNRREGLGALRRADAVIVREEEGERVIPRLRGLLRNGAAIWTVRRAIDFGGASEVLGGLVAFCAIARPEDFFETLRSEGARVVRAESFPDHHSYTAADMGQLTQAWHRSGGDAFITTEKDAVKLTPELRAQLEANAPLRVARLQAAFLDPEAVLRGLEARLK